MAKAYNPKLRSNQGNIRPGPKLIDAGAGLSTIASWFSYLSRRGDCGTIELSGDFHTHDFEQHANASAVVQMRETAKRLREWPR